MFFDKINSFKACITYMAGFAVGLLLGYFIVKYSLLLIQN